MDMITVSAKTVDEAITKALIELETTSDKLVYEVIDKGSTGFLGIGAKPAIIRAKKEVTIEDKAIEFLDQVFEAMNLQVTIETSYKEEEKELSINLVGDDMGILIGKRGQTLDSLQYLVGTEALGQVVDLENRMFKIPLMRTAHAIPRPLPCRRPAAGLPPAHNLPFRPFSAPTGGAGRRTQGSCTNRGSWRWSPPGSRGRAPRWPT